MAKKRDGQLGQARIDVAALVPLLDAVPEGILIADLDGAEIYANTTARSLLGRGAHALLCKRPTRLELPPQGAGPPTRTRRRYRVAYFDLFNNAGMVIAQGALIGLMGRGISARERRLQARVAQLEAIIADIDAQIVAVLPGGAKAPAEEPAETFRRSNMTPHQQALMKALQSGGAIGDIAEMMGISTHAVRNDLRSILRKLGIESLEELLAL